MYIHTYVCYIQKCIEISASFNHVPFFLYSHFRSFVSVYQLTNHFAITFTFTPRQIAAFRYEIKKINDLFEIMYILLILDHSVPDSR